MTKIIPVSRPKLVQKDFDAVLTALTNLELSGHSKEIQKFESTLGEFLKSRSDVIAVSSGTSALDLIADALNISNTSTVICSSFTIISSVAEIARRGAKIIFIDADPENWCLDLKELERALIDYPEASAVYATHIYNSAFDASKVVDITASRKICFVEDAAEALGSTLNGKPLGTYGDIGIFSFYANKLITTGEGGAIITSNPEFNQKLRSLRNLGFNVSSRFIHQNLGRNVRMPGINAALGTSQVGSIRNFLNHRELLYKKYFLELSSLEEISFQKIDFSALKFKSSYWVMPILLTKLSKFSAEEFQELLLEEGIESRRFFYPLHLQPALRQIDSLIYGSGRVSEELWERGLYLPMGSGIELNEVGLVCEKIRKIFSKK